jgi:ParB family chromosome partitioning protein
MSWPTKHWRASTPPSAARPRSRPHRLVARSTADEEPARFSVRAFVLTWGELETWWTHYDVDELAADLTDEQIAAFFAAVEGTAAFADRAPHRPCGRTAGPAAAARPLNRRPGAARRGRAHLVV